MKYLEAEETLEDLIIWIGSLLVEDSFADRNTEAIRYMMNLAKQAEEHTECKYCDINSDECCIFVEPMSGDWYLKIETSEYDDLAAEYVTYREWISYCPYCGRKLGGDNG